MNLEYASGEFGQGLGLGAGDTGGIQPHILGHAASGVGGFGAEGGTTAILAGFRLDTS